MSTYPHRLAAHHVSRTSISASTFTEAPTDTIAGARMNTAGYGSGSSTGGETDEDDPPVSPASVGVGKTEEDTSNSQLVCVLEPFHRKVIVSMMVVWADAESRMEGRARPRLGLYNDPPSV